MSRQVLIAAEIIVFLAYHGVNVFLAWQSKQSVQRRINHKDLSQLNHFTWGLLYAGICALSFKFGWLFVASLIPLHLSIFPIWYNLFRGLELFNLSRTSKASTDKIMVRMGLKSTEVVNFAAELLATALLIIQIRNL